MTPQEIIYKNKDLIVLALEHGYIPHSSQPNFGEVKAALQQIDGISRDGGCQGCISEVIRCANVHLKAFEATIPVYKVTDGEVTGVTLVGGEDLKNSTAGGVQFHTFPKHEKNEDTTGTGGKTNPKKARKNKKEDRGV